MRTSQKHRDRNKLTKRLKMEYIRRYKETNKCATCPEARAACLEFHHNDPSLKRFELHSAKSYGYETIDAEISKCSLLCANCHRIVHAEDARAGLAAVRDEGLEETLFDGM